MCLLARSFSLIGRRGGPPRAPAESALFLYRAQDNPRQPRKRSALAAGPDERLSLIDQPAWAHANDPIPSRGFGAGQASIAVGGLGRPGPVINGRGRPRHDGGCASIGAVLRDHEPSPPGLWDKRTTGKAPSSKLTMREAGFVKRIGPAALARVSRECGPLAEPVWWLSS
jgi:hypothetical protein